MSDLTLVFTPQRHVLVTGGLDLTLVFPPLFPGPTLPLDGDPGDVLTWDGDSWEPLPPGAGDNFQTYPAGENLSAGRVVVIDNGQAWYFQNTNAAFAGRAYGVTKTSAAMGADVTIQTAGIIEDAAFFNFTADTIVWVGADGEIFNVQPIGGVLVQKAGVASEDKKMLIDFSIQILKN